VLRSDTFEHPDAEDGSGVAYQADEYLPASDLERSEDPEVAESRHATEIVNSGELDSDCKSMKTYNYP